LIFICKKINFFINFFINLNGIFMEELSGLDASFLYLETSKIPMHIGGVAILEGSLKCDGFRQYLSERVHTVEKLTQKLVTVPLSLDRPYWVEDPGFDINMHLHRTALPRPGGWKELRYLASRLCAPGYYFR
jgi:diacylglycerol O-acyltransferase